MNKSAAVLAVVPLLLGAASLSSITNLRMILRSHQGIASPAEGEVAYDTQVQMPLLRVGGFWWSPRFGRDLVPGSERMPDFTGNADGSVTVQAGTVVLKNGTSFENTSTVGFTPPASPAMSQYVVWRALFAIPTAAADGFRVVMSSDFSTPDTIPGDADPDTVSLGEYRYLGSVGLRPADGFSIYMQKVGNRYSYLEPANVIKDTSGPVQLSTIDDVSPAAQSLSVSLEYFDAGRLSGPLGETLAVLETTVTDSVQVDAEVARLNGVFQFSGPLQNCDADQAAQFITGHSEDPSLFIN